MGREILFRLFLVLSLATFNKITFPQYTQVVFMNKMKEKQKQTNRQKESEMSDKRKRALVMIVIEQLE